jgi:RNA polymerase sigma factor (sigma-70 family)
VAYLYRVGQSRIRRRRVRLPFVRSEYRDPEVEPELMEALRALSGQQRVAVVLIHGYAWTMAEVAELLDVSVSTVQTHLERGLGRLRSQIGEEQT